jgi:hypothetical protein
MTRPFYLNVTVRRFCEVDNQTRGGGVKLCGLIPTNGNCESQVSVIIVADNHTLSIEVALNITLDEPRSSQEAAPTNTDAPLKRSLVSSTPQLNAIVTGHGRRSTVGY